MAKNVHNRKNSSSPLPTRYPACLNNEADMTGLRPEFINWLVVFNRRYRNICLCISDDSQLVSLAVACWSKVILERQQMLEESYKIEISVSHTVKTKHVSMTDISPLWEEMAFKTWLLYTG